MSNGSLIELVSRGIQDAYLTGEPSVSFFRQRYNKHTNFSTFPVRLLPVGNMTANGEVTLPIERKGDLLAGIWVHCDGSNVNTRLGNDTKFSLHIGGQKIDEQDSYFSNYIHEKFLKSGSSQCRVTGTPNAAEPVTELAGSSFLPLHFFCCDNYSGALPLVALQYAGVEVRVSFGSSTPTDVKFYAQYICLDADERRFFVENDQEILIHQVQKISSGASDTDLSYLNHPVKGLFWGPSSHTGTLSTSAVQLRVNGISVFDTPMPDVYFSHVQPLYHCSNFSRLQAGGNTTLEGGNFKMYSFALDVNKNIPTGSLNFSRLDNAKLSWTASGTPSSIYAVNFNILRIAKGLAGVAFSN